MQTIKLELNKIKTNPNYFDVIGWDLLGCKLDGTTLKLQFLAKNQKTCTNSELQKMYRHTFDSLIIEQDFYGVKLSRFEQKNSNKILEVSFASNTATFILNSGILIFNFDDFRYRNITLKDKLQKRDGYFSFDNFFCYVNGFEHPDCFLCHDEFIKLDYDGKNITTSYTLGDWYLTNSYNKTTDILYKGSKYDWEYHISQTYYNVKNIQNERFLNETVDVTSQKSKTGKDLSIDIRDEDHEENPYPTIYFEFDYFKWGDLIIEYKEKDNSYIPHGKKVKLPNRMVYFIAKYAFPAMELQLPLCMEDLYSIQEYADECELNMIDENGDDRINYPEEERDSLAMQFVDDIFNYADDEKVVDLEDLNAKLSKYKHISSYKRRKSIKEIFDEHIRIRKLDDEDNIAKFGHPFGDYADYADYEYLLRDYDETVIFLLQADEEEIAFSVEFLDNMVDYFPKDKAQAIIDIFRAKFIQFPNVEDVCRFDYVETIDEAQSFVDEKE